MNIGRRGTIALIAICVADILWLFYVSQAHAQTLSNGERAYTTADPVRENGIGLATQTGRWAVSLSDRCAVAEVGAGINVEMWYVEGFSGIATIAPLDDQGNWDANRWCGVRFEQQADPTPCFVNAEGACDIASEGY